MFKKVKLKLTIINITVVGVILLLFFSGIYLLMKQNTERQSEQLLRSVVVDLRKRELRPNLPLQMKHWGNFFYVKYDSTGKLIDQSAELPVTKEDLDALLSEVFQQTHEKGLIKLESDTFRFLKSFPLGLQDVTAVFLSTQPEREILRRLGTILVSIGLAGLAVVFVSSLFLADRALIPIKQAWERQKNFVADASHELRSPLAVMQTSLELVMGNKDETVESQTKWLENIETENKRMTKLVTDLLLLARADSDQQLMNKGLFPLHKTVREAVASFEPVASKKNIQLELIHEDEIDFFGDENRLKQLTVILIDNAIKYTPSGGHAEISIRKHDSHVELLVTDTGEGIGSEHLDKIFERFYRIDKARSRDSGGTGLGLSIADWIAKEHKGSISVSSTPGKGSAFKVQLPILLQKD